MASLLGASGGVMLAGVDATGVTDLGGSARLPRRRAMSASAVLPVVALGAGAVGATWATGAGAAGATGASSTTGAVVLVFTPSRARRAALAEVGAVEDMVSVSWVVLVSAEPSPAKMERVAFRALQRSRNGQPP